MRAWRRQDMPLGKHNRSVELRLERPTSVRRGMPFREMIASSSTTKRRIRSWSQRPAVSRTLTLMAVEATGPLDALLSDATRTPSAQTKAGVTVMSAGERELGYVATVEQTLGVDVGARCPGEEFVFFRVLVRQTSSSRSPEDGVRSRTYRRPAVEWSQAGHWLPDCAP